MRGFGRWLRSNTPIDEGYKECFSKAAYRTEKLAKEVIEQRQDKEKYILRYYKCDICSFFHLTKKPGIQQTYEPEPVIEVDELTSYIQKHRQILLDMEKYYDAGLFAKYNEVKKKKKELLKEVKEKGLRIP